MKKIYLLMLREMKYNAGQFLSIVFIIAIGSFMFCGMLSTILSIKHGVEDYYENQKLADLWVNFNQITEEELQTLETTGDYTAEGRYVLNTEAVMDGELVNLRAYSMTESNTLYLQEGLLPSKSYECVIDSKFAKANDIMLGDTMSITAESGELLLTIVGIGDSPDNAYKIKDSATARVSQKTFSIVYCTKNTMTELIKMSQPYLEQEAQLRAKYPNKNLQEKALEELAQTVTAYNEVLVRTDDPMGTVQVLEQQEKFLSYTEREDQPSFSAVQNGIDSIGTIAYLFPFVFFFVAALILFITMAKMVENHRTQLGVIQAMGFHKGSILGGYLFYGATAGLLGSVLFAYFGKLLIPKVLIRMFRNRYALGSLQPETNIYLLFVPFLLALVFSSAAVLFAIGSVLKCVPAQVMRPKPPRKSRTILFEKVSFLWNRLSYSSKLISRNIFLNKKRVLLSSIGIIGSVMLMITGISLKNAADTLLSSKQNSMAYDVSVVYDTQIESWEELDFPIDIDTIELTKNLRAKLSPEEASTISLQILPEGSQLVKLYDDKKSLLQLSGESVILPDTFAREQGLAIGDSLKLTIEDQEYHFTVTGISVQYTDKIIYLSEQAAQNVGLNINYNTALLKLSDPNEVETLKQELTNTENVKAVNTKADIIGSAQENLTILNAIILIIIAAAAFMSVVVIYNITAINLFERSREYATLMVLGYYKHEVSRLLFADNIVLAVLGCIGGVPCGIFLFRQMLASFADNQIILPSEISNVTIGISFGLIFFFTLGTCFLLKKRIGTIDKIEALKGVE